MFKAGMDGIEMVRRAMPSLKYGREQCMIKLYRVNGFKYDDKIMSFYDQDWERAVAFILLRRGLWYGFYGQEMPMQKSVLASKTFLISFCIKEGF